MEYDHTYNGAVDWNFPSPSATPTAANFQQHVYQTPKTATFPSHFNDAFSTPQMPGYATPQQPEYSTMTPIQGQQQSTSDMLRNNYYATMQASGGAAQQSVMPPPQQVMYQNTMVSPVYAHSQAPSAQPGTALSFDASPMQMQTPPPTRGTSVKKPTPSQQVAFGTPSTIASRRLNTSQQQVLISTQQAQGQAHTPMQYPQLQFPPQVYQFGNMGPQTAPVFPSTQIMWDQNASPAIYTQQQPRLDDPFAPTTSSAMAWPSQLMPTNNAMGVSFQTPTMTSFPLQSPMERPASAAPAALTQQLQPAPFITSGSVDPSLVYSSPIRPTVPPKSEPGNTKIAAPKSETQRKDSGNAEHKRTDTVSSTDTFSTAASFQSLRRSNTTGTTRPPSVPRVNRSDSISRSNSTRRPPRTSSPLKRVGRLPLGSISETKKTTPRALVILTIDDTGHARAVTQQVATDIPSKSNLDKYQERFPGLFDSDSSDAESEEEQTPSRTASFSFAQGEERKPKAAKLDPPVENLVGLSIPRTNSSASLKVTPSRASIAAAAQLRRSGSLRKRTPSRNGQRRFAHAAAPSIDTAPMEMQTDRNQSVAGAHDPSLSPDWPGDAVDQHNRRWSMMPVESQQAHQFPGRGSASHELRDSSRFLIRCPCGIPEDRGQSLVQCISCTQHSHLPCVDLSPGSLPSAFTCFLCTKPASGLKVKVGSRTR